MRVSKGFNEIPESAFQLNSFQIDREFQDHNLEEISISSNWLADTETVIELNASLDLERVKEICKLSGNEIILASLRSYCKTTTLQHFSKPVRIESDKIELLMRIPEFEWANQATIKVSIAVQNVDPSHEIAGKPSLEFSRLFERTWSFILSGTYTRVDVQSVGFDFDSSKRNALWEIFLSLPMGIESWKTVEQSGVIRVRLNEDRLEAMQDANVKALLKVDLIMAALGTVFDAEISDAEREQILQSISNPPQDSGSWLRFLSTYFSSAFPSGIIGASQFWRDRQNEIRTRIQSFVGGI